MDTARTLPGLLEARLETATPALIERDRPVSYARLLDESRRVAAGLAALGVRPGDRVALWMPNVPAWLATFFACAQLGAIAVAVNTRFRSLELSDIVGRSGCKVLVYWPGFKRADFAGVLSGCDPAALACIENVVAYGEDGEALPATALDKPVLPYVELAATPALATSVALPGTGCAIFTTSGTTKAPKFVLHDQQTLIAHAFDVVSGFSLHPRSVLYLAPPLCGVFGTCNALAAIAAGRPLVMTPSWDAAETLRQVDVHGVTHLNATDDAIAQLLAATPRTPILPTVEFVGYAAFNPALDDIVPRADARGLKLVGLYGISEIQALFARQDENASLAERMLAGGRPVSAGSQVRARDPDTGRVLAHDEPGELEFLAPHSRMVGYFGNDAATAEALTEDGWYRSGDLGYTQADGRFVYLTRMGDSLRLAGFLVSPLEIEGAVQECDGIDACQVVGATVGGGLKPVGFVTLKPGRVLDEAAVIGHVSARLAKYKVPVRLFAIDAFPVTEGTNATKIQKHKLRDLAQAQIASAPVSPIHRTPPMTELSPAARAELAPTGKLRVAVNLSNFLLVTKDPATGGMTGVVPDLANEIGKRLGVAVEFFGYASPGQVADAAKTGVWDIAFLGAEPARATEIDFSAAYLEIEASYLVPPGSPIKAIEEVDREGVRISLYGRSAYDLYLTRTIKHAQLLRVDGIEASWQQFLDKKLEALAGLMPRLVVDLENLPGSRILPGRFTAVQQAIGAPKGRSEAAKYLCGFSEEAKAKGLVAAAIARHGVRGVSVAPLA